LVRSAKKPILHEKATRCHGFLNKPTSSDISGIQNVQSYSPEFKITSQKYLVRSMDEFLDSTHNPPAREILKKYLVRSMDEFLDSTHNPPAREILKKYLVRSMDEFLDSTHNPPT